MRDWVPESVMSPLFWVILVAAIAITLSEGWFSRAKRKKDTFILHAGWFTRALFVVVTLGAVGICIASWFSDDAPWSGRWAYTAFAGAALVGLLAFFRLRVVYCCEGIAMSRYFGLGPTCSISWEDVEGIEDDFDYLRIQTKSGKRWKIPTLLRGHRDFLAFAEQRLADEPIAVPGEGAAAADDRIEG